jgi:hypothetical protein
MDIQIPRADVIETSLELGQRCADHERPTIIALTANATARDREKAYDAGMRMHIAKLILPNDLATALMSVVLLNLPQQAVEATRFFLIFLFFRFLYGVLFVFALASLGGACLICVPNSCMLHGSFFFLSDFDAVYDLI